ncbi:C-terminal binding protein [Bengtsoniella intestinalis]|uniref:C-terminal binding protein n=1 Tax=Bengtsoniella intestinalis TaxID=3073143 RepID=UPI00391F564E
MSMKIIISDCDHASMDQEKAVLAEAGIPFVQAACKTEDDLIANCAGYNVVLNQYAPFTRNVISKLAPDLKHIVRYGVGVNNVDLEAATEYGVQVCNVPDYGMNEVADQAVALMMALVRKVCLMNRFTKEEAWEYAKCLPVYRIPGSVVGIVGLGRIGQVFAKRMSGFDMERIAFDPAYEIGTFVNGVEIVSFETLIERSDMISIHSPLIPETRDLFNLDTFKKMKDTAYVVNTARGGIINEADLLTALQEKMIAGAGLDVVDVEPMSPGHPLFAFENFLCTPTWHGTPTKPLWN